MVGGRNSIRGVVPSSRAIAYGACAEVDPALFVEEATVEWHVTASGRLQVKVQIDDSYAVAARHDGNAKGRN